MDMLQVLVAVKEDVDGCMESGGFFGKSFFSLCLFIPHFSSFMEVFLFRSVVLIIGLG